MPYKSNIPAIVKALEVELSHAVNRCGLRIEAGAKRRARVKTGYMRGEIRWISIDEFSGEVIGGADYTIHNEYGTVYMSAQPMFVPATEEARPFFIKDIEDGVRRAVAHGRV